MDRAFPNISQIMVGQYQILRMSEMSSREVPAGIIAMGSLSNASLPSGLFASPLTTSWTVPSPPTQSMASKLLRGILAASLIASFGPVVTTTCEIEGGLPSRIRSTISQPAATRMGLTSVVNNLTALPFPDFGLMNILKRLAGGATIRYRDESVGPEFLNAAKLSTLEIYRTQSWEAGLRMNSYILGSYCGGLNFARECIHVIITRSLPSVSSWMRNMSSQGISTAVNCNGKRKYDTVSSA